jgi:hypothetical protein
MKYNNRNQKFQTTRINVKFRNKINNEITIGDLINEEFIDNKPYYVVRVVRGVIKLAKDAYTIVT